jgi:hypothetical protein
MITVRHIEKLYTGRAYSKMVVDLFKGRPEFAGKLIDELSSEPAAIALSLIRLDELSQAHVPLYGRLLRRLITLQSTDGGWIDPATTALAAKALSLQSGGGVAITRAFDYLANLQKESGIWPSHPIRRMDGDPLVSAFILYHLADLPGFRERVRLEDATRWFEAEVVRADVETATLWRRGNARRRTRSVALQPSQAEFSWS